VGQPPKTLVGITRLFADADEQYEGFPFGEFISDVPHFLQNVTIFFSPSLHDMGNQETPFPTSLCE
jgi:hypothetical protein